MLKSKQVPIEFYAKQKKFKKYHKLKPKNSIHAISALERGHFCFNNSVVNPTVKQIVAITKIVKPGMKVFSRRARLRFYPILDVMLTRKPKDIRMGRGKGAPTEKVAVLQNGQKILKLRGLKQKDSATLYKKTLPKFLVKSEAVNTNKW